VADQPDEPATCSSTYPQDPSVRCERPAGHTERMLHCNGAFRPDGPYYEWEDQ
jgi:hypothetical protein